MEMSAIQAGKGKVWKSIGLNKAAVKSQKRFPTAVLFAERTCPNVADLNCLIFYEFFQKRKKPYKWRKNTDIIKNLQI